MTVAHALGAHHQRLDHNDDTFVIDQNGSDIQVSKETGSITAGIARQTSGPIVFQPRFYTRDNKTGGAPRDTADITNAHKAGDSAPVVALEIHGGSKRKDRPDGGFYVREMPTSKPLDTGGLNPNCQQGGVVAIQHSIIGRKLEAGAQGKGWRDDGATWTLDSRADADAVAGSFGVRRLTPLECERLQGFPDTWTAGMSDSARYRMLGNAVAVPVAEWIGKRIMALDKP